MENNRKVCIIIKWKIIGKFTSLLSKIIGKFTTDVSISRRGNCNKIKQGGSLMCVCTKSSDRANPRSDLFFYQMRERLKILKTSHIA